MVNNKRRSKSRVTIDEDIAEDLAERRMISIDSIGRIRGISGALRRMGWGKK
ncbi:MAG: hypothetical protein M0Q91_05325 [Methanoregula sp.]|jgi:hypothetical protein|nr:hypothetical protein [Methanoregula sp.]